MAGKGSRKDRKISKKKEKGLAADTFIWEVLSYILPLCGFPAEKIESKELQPVEYPEDNYIIKFSATVLTVAFSKRDDWKTIFESRFKSSGFDTIEKIGKYMKSFLAINPEFQQCNNPGRTHMCLAAYSEVMLFLNCKGVEIDFEQMLDLCTRHFAEINRLPSIEGEFLNKFFPLFVHPDEFFEWISPFLRRIGNPYGRRDDVSKKFLQRKAALKTKVDEGNWELAHMYASVMTVPPVLPEDFESAAVLPGGRASSPVSPDSSAPKSEKKRRSRPRSTKVSESVSEGRQRKTTAPELGITDRLGQISLSGESSPEDKKENRRKPKDRKSQ